MLVRKFAYRLFYFFNRFCERLLSKLYTGYVTSRVHTIGEGCKIGGPITVIYPQGLVIGNFVFIGNGSNLECRGGVIIGNRTFISNHVAISSTLPHYQGQTPVYENLLPKRVVIDEGVWIGPYARIQPGVTIGKGAVIGMGCLVNRDVMPGEVFQNDSSGPQIKRKVVGPDEHIQGTYDESGNSSYSPTEAITNGSNLFFVVSTGRSGSNAVTYMASQYADVVSKHESLYVVLKTLSFDFLTGAVSEEYVRQELVRLIGLLPFPSKHSIHIESDQKLTPFILLLHDLFPKAKFIGIVRNPRSFVKSAAARGWFDKDRPLLFESKVVLQLRHSSHGCRVTGDLVGEIDSEKWQSMSQNERILWYWRYWNSMIVNSFDLLPQSSSLLLTLEDLPRLDILLPKFLGVPRVKIRSKKTNVVRKSERRRYRAFRLSHEEQVILEECMKMYRDIGIKSNETVDQALAISH